MAGSAQMILITVRRQRADPKTLLQSLAANSAAVLATQVFLHAPNFSASTRPSD